MKKGKKMSKKMVGLMVGGILVLVLGLVSTPASAQLSGGISYYSPGFGKINDYFDEQNDRRGTNLEFKAGMMYGFALGYEVNPRFRLRLEYNGFKSRTRDSYWVDHGLSRMDYWDEYWKLTVLPVILFGIYKFSLFYIGAGVGLYPTMFKLDYSHEQYLEGILEDGWSGSISDSDKPTGLVLLVGFEFGGKPILLNLEIRYIVGTKAKLEDFGTEVDLSGLQFSLLGGFEFK